MVSQTLKRVPYNKKKHVVVKMLSNFAELLFATKRGRRDAPFAAPANKYESRGVRDLQRENQQKTKQNSVLYIVCIYMYLYKYI